MTIALAPLESFQEDPPRVEAARGGAAETDSLLLNIDGYEGPMDVLLELARNQKVDLAKISILQLVRQYLDFVERAKALHLELAAEYMVMAAWLAYLKSRLLLPREPESAEPNAEAMAEALQFQLRRLEAMRKAAETLDAMPQLGREVFGRGAPEGLPVRTTARWDVNLYELLKAYGDIKKREEESHYELPIFNVMPTEDAMVRLTRMLGQLPKKGMQSVWATLESFLPEQIRDPLYARSARASIFTASLELVKQGTLEIKQDGLFRPIYMRTAHREPVMEDAP